jgi:predicted kinase
MTQHSNSIHQAKLILLIGLPGSGKSTLAKQLLANYPQSQLISTDTIRGKLFGDEANQGCWMLVWQEVQRQFQLAASGNQTAIYDATNVTRCNRRQVIDIARTSGFSQIVGIWLQTPIWLCLAHNKRRQRNVSEKIIFLMHRQLQGSPPSTTEGFDDLICGSEISQIMMGKNHT